MCLCPRWSTVELDPMSSASFIRRSPLQFCWRPPGSESESIKSSSCTGTRFAGFHQHTNHTLRPTEFCNDWWPFRNLFFILKCYWQSSHTYNWYTFHVVLACTMQLQLKYFTLQCPRPPWKRKRLREASGFVVQGRSHAVFFPMQPWMANSVFHSVHCSVSQFFESPLWHCGSD